MIDLKKLLKNFEEISKKLILRGVKKEFLEEIKIIILKKKSIVTEINNLRNRETLLIKIIKKKTNIYEEEIKKNKEEIKNKEHEYQKIEKEFNEKCSYLPNIQSEDVPIENFIIKKKEFKNKKSSFTYEEIIEKKNFVDFKRSSKLSGSKFVIYNEEGTKILHSLISFMLSENRKNGYNLVSVPYIVKKSSLYNTGQLPKFSEDIFSIEDTDMALIPTSEVSLINMYSNEIIDEKKFPIKISSYSACFRAEAGSAGRENKSLIRLHQFNKVEIVKITSPESSYKELDLLVNDVCKILEKLQITYRIVLLSLKELGITSSKTFDIEIWLPNSKKWIEISSCSNCEDFQSNRSKIRMKRNGSNIHPHTLNGSSLAIDRLILAILEYYYNDQNELIELPDELKKFYEVY